MNEAIRHKLIEKKVHRYIPTKKTHFFKTVPGTLARYVTKPFLTLPVRQLCHTNLGGMMTFYCSTVANMCVSGCVEIQFDQL